jgi:hypothetical protein
MLHMDKGTVSRLMSELGKVGGKARAKALSAKERTAIATRASKAAAKARTKAAKARRKAANK